MKKVYFLQTCDTCRRILKEVNIPDFEQQEIKTTPVSVAQLEAMQQLSGSYESLLNKRAKLYTEMGLKNKILSESDCKQLILDAYTFLKRPVFIVENEIFIGNSKKVIAELKVKINSSSPKTF